MKKPKKIISIMSGLQVLSGVLFSISIIVAMGELSELPGRYDASSALASSAVQATQLSNAAILAALPLIGGIVQKLALFIIIYFCLKALKDHILTAGVAEAEGDKGGFFVSPQMKSAPAAPTAKKAPARKTVKKKADSAGTAAP